MDITDFKMFSSVIVYEEIARNTRSCALEFLDSLDGTYSLIWIYRKTVETQNAASSYIEFHSSKFLADSP